MYLRVIVLAGMVLALASCMQALQTGNTKVMQPSPSQSGVTGTSPGLTTTLSQTVTTTIVTAMMEPSPVPSATEAMSTSSPAEVALPTATAQLVPTVARPTQTATVTPTVAATNTPTATATPTPAPPTATPTPSVTIVLPTLPSLTNEERWRLQQKDRQPFDEFRPYTTTGSDLWWYDPVNQQHVVLGNFSGPFEAQATFKLANNGKEALEVPYHVNQSYGITAISSALLQRIQDAGYGEWIETYIIITPDVQPR